MAGDRQAVVLPVGHAAERPRAGAGDGHDREVRTVECRGHIPHSVRMPSCRRLTSLSMHPCRFLAADPACRWRHGAQQAPPQAPPQAPAGGTRAGSTPRRRAKSPGFATSPAWTRPSPCGGALSSDAMTSIKQAGFRSIVNLRAATEEGANVEAETKSAQDAGVSYIWLPFVTASPDASKVDDFLKAVVGPGQPAHAAPLHERRAGVDVLGDQARPGGRLARGQGHGRVAGPVEERQRAPQGLHCSSTSSSTGK